MCKFSTGKASIYAKKHKFLTIYPYFDKIKEHIKNKYDFNLYITNTQKEYIKEQIIYKLIKIYGR